MWLLRSLLFLAILPTAWLNAQSYKGIFLGYNYSTTNNVVGIGGWQSGFHFGYAVRGDLSKPVTIQLEIMSMMEGSSDRENDQVLRLAYLKAPILVNIGINQDHKPKFRLVLGAQPTLYMGGFLKIGHKHYLPKFIQDDDKIYLQPDFNYFEAGRFGPKDWNIEPTIGLESCRKKSNFGIRVALGLIDKNRFQNTSICFRIGF